MDLIESKQILVESVAEPVTEPLTETVVEAPQSGFKSSIAQQLLREFSIAEAIPTQAELSGNGVRANVDTTTTPGAEGAATKPATDNPWPENSPQAQAWEKLSATDQTWLGKADPTDKFILARAPNKGGPEGGAATKPAPVIDRSTPAPGGEPIPAPAVTTTPIPGDAKQMGQISDVKQMGQPGAATKPTAAPKDPAVAKIQQDLVAKGAVNTTGPRAGQPLDVDGIMGPNTKAAQEKFGATATAGAPDPAKMKRFKDLLAKASGTA